MNMRSHGMRIRVLGSAAGGGVPQWNCNCALCREARSGSGHVRPRTQSSVAISANGVTWFLLNASPDLRAQLEAFPALRPAASVGRGSPVQAVLLTNADLDHTLGLLLMREGDRLLVNAPTAVRKSLTDGAAFGTMLDSFCGISWIEPPPKPAPLLNRDDTPSGLRYEAISLAGKPPRFFKSAGETTGNAVGYRITDEKTGGRLLFAPDVSSLTKDLIEQLTESDAVLFDGTFWSENEMRERGCGSMTAAEMGHVPISGGEGSLKVLSKLPVKHRVYVHVNNTNPVLMEDSPERAAVVAAGCVVAWDGLELDI